MIMDDRIIKLCKECGLDAASMLAFIQVETGGYGFDPKTGKILIQFEPVWFKREAPYAPSGLWSLNKVEVQSKEWIAFNDAFGKNKDAAMKATSIGLAQIMGFQYQRLGYKTVGQMWDDAKKGLDRQIWQLVKFINTDSKLKVSLMNADWATVAMIYNGKGYEQLARKYGRKPYDESMKEAYEKFKNI